MASLQPSQVAPLPIGSGGANRATIKQLNDNHTTLTLMMAQAKANTVYDPPTPQTLTPQLVQPFCGSSMPRSHVVAEWIAALGVAAIAYGILADK